MGKIFLAAGMLFCFGHALALELEVNSLADPGTGDCDVSECTLREALAVAQETLELTTINFADGLNGVITLTSMIEINAFNVVVNGPGPEVISVSGNDAYRVFRLDGDNITLRGLTIRNAYLASGSGGGIWVLGEGSLLENLRIINGFGEPGTSGLGITIGQGTVRNVEISDNNGNTSVGMSINPAPGKSVLVENVTISGNTATNQTNAIRVLTNEGSTVTFRYLTVAGNTGAQGGTLLSGAEDSIFVEASIFADHSGTREDLNASPTAVVINNTVVESVEQSLVGENNVIADPGLLPLAFVDGSNLRVHAFPEGSAAFNHVESSTGDPQCGTGVATDQVGNPRPRGPKCDAGAHELALETIFEDGFEL
jgi:CSLREA domain-containing protein